MLILGRATGILHGRKKSKPHKATKAVGWSCSLLSFFRTLVVCWGTPLDKKSKKRKSRKNKKSNTEKCLFRMQLHLFLWVIFTRM